MTPNIGISVWFFPIYPTQNAICKGIKIQEEEFFAEMPLKILK